MHSDRGSAPGETHKARQSRTHLTHVDALGCKDGATHEVATRQRGIIPYVFTYVTVCIPRGLRHPPAVGDNSIANYACIKQDIKTLAFLDRTTDYLLIQSEL